MKKYFLKEKQLIITKKVKKNKKIKKINHLKRIKIGEIINKTKIDNINDKIIENSNTHESS
jgi:mannitol-specific phosphotransferase system IIBC component